MAAYIVAYDLCKAGQNYECLSKKLEAYGTHWHFQGSVWIIETGQSAEQISNNLAPCLDSNDKLFVGRLAGEAAWIGYDKAGDDWIMSVLP